jgi:hypothetical protein
MRVDLENDFVIFTSNTGTQKIPIESITSVTIFKNPDRIAFRAGTKRFLIRSYERMDEIAGYFRKNIAPVQTKEVRRWLNIDDPFHRVLIIGIAIVSPIIVYWVAVQLGVGKWVNPLIFIVCGCYFFSRQKIMVSVQRFSAGFL